MTDMIVAFDREGVIGRDNTLPWAGEMPSDMAHFRDHTIGRDVIMGRATWDSLPERFRPLPDRLSNIVLSLSQKALEGAVVVDSIERALQVAQDPVVIGGAQIYELSLPYTDRIITTHIDTSVEGGTAFFPVDFNTTSEWVVDTETDYQQGPRDKYASRFVTYVRRHPIVRLDSHE